jgi:hypothetical protein
MGMRAFTRRWGVVSAMVAVLLTAGCGQSEAPAEPKLPPSESSAPKPESEPSGMTDEESVEAFVREWAREHTEMYNSGDIESFVALSSKCEPCLETARRVERAYDSGGWVRSEPWRLTRVRADRYPGNAAKWAVTFTLHDPGIEFQDSSSEEPGSFRAATTKNQVDVDTRRETWVVTAFREFAE